MKLRRILSCIMGVCSLLTVGGVAATWSYAGGELINSMTPQQLPVAGGSFIYVPEEMPDEQVTAIQRLSDILNKKYKTETVQDSLDYLLNETIQVFWGGDKTQDPYVGSMDTTYDEQVDELFQDVLFETNLSFILKNQDLNGDGYNEIAMYSTTDTLDNTTANYDGVVCVYVTVFTPTVDSNGNVIGYTMVCESLRGYCYEIWYSPNGDDQYIPSFSTDEWRASVAYTRSNRDYELPDEAQLDFDSYNQYYTYRNRQYATKPYGNTLSTELSGKIPYIS